MKGTLPTALAPERQSVSRTGSQSFPEKTAGGLPTPVLRPLQAVLEEPLARDEEAIGEGRSTEPSRRVARGIEHHFAGNRAREEPSQRRWVVAHRDEQKHESVVVRPCEVEERGQLAAAGRAPRGPEVHEDDTSTEGPKRHEGAIEAAKAHVGSLLDSSQRHPVEGVRVRPLRGGADAVQGDEQPLEQEHANDRGAVPSRDRAEVLAKWARHDGRRVVARTTSPRNRGAGAILRVALALLAIVFVTASCSRKSTERPSAPSATPAQTFKGGPAAHPGDWCTTHGVPESECTRCNAELVPQFRARHDWCEEHGVPDSQCVLCHPELQRQGVAPPRPRAPASPDEHPATPSAQDGSAGVTSGTVVRFARPVVAERVGVETVPAEGRALADEVSVPVRLDFDPSRLARVSARVAGVVRTVAVDLGATIHAGSVLATLDSPAAAATRADLLARQVRLANAEVALRRAREVQAAGAGTRAEIEAAETSLAAARADLESMRASSVATGAGAGRVVRILAPRAGVVVRRAVSVGQQVTAEEVLVEVADLSTLWALLDVPDTDAPRLRVGQSVTIEMEGIATPFQAALTWLSPVVDPHTRTVQARAELRNADGALRANAFGRARITVGASSAGVVVPRDALQRVREEDVVFIARSPVAYEARVVEVARRTAREAQLARGVEAGERVVTTGSFELKTELLRESIGAGCCDDEG